MSAFMDRQRQQLNSEPSPMNLIDDRFSSAKLFCCPLLHFLMQKNNALDSTVLQALFNKKSFSFFNVLGNLSFLY